MSASENPVGLMVGVIGAAIVIIIGLAVMGPVATLAGSEVTASEDAQFQGRVTDSVRLDDGVQFYQINDGTGDNQTVVDSRGYAVNLTGASDSYVEADQNIDVATDDTWTVATWANVDSASAGANMTLLTIGGQLVVWYNGSASEYQAWYYDDSSGSSTQVNVSAPNQPGSFSQVMVSLNQSTLTIYANATPGESKTVSASDAAAAPVNTTNYDGRLDELRTWDDVLNSTQRNDTVSDPVGSERGNRTARVYWDMPNQSTQPIYFTSAQMTQSNVTYSQGLAGNTLEEKTGTLDTSGDNDYRWRDNGPQIAQTVDGATTSGRLEFAPAVFVTYDYTTASTGSTIAQIAEAMEFGAAALVVLIAGMILAVVARFRGGA